MDQTEFQKALKKYENRKKKQTVANPELKPESFKVNTALPFEPIYNQTAKKEKPVEAPRPKPKPLEVTITGPVELKFSIEWSGALLAGQMTPQALRGMFFKQLTPFGKVMTK